MSRKSELRRLTAELETADSYEVWRQAASQHDELSGALRWRLEVLPELFRPADSLVATTPLQVRTGLARR